MVRPMYAPRCLHCQSANLVKLDNQLVTGEGVEPVTGEGYRCLECGEISRFVQYGYFFNDFEGLKSVIDDVADAINQVVEQLAKDILTQLPYPPDVRDPQAVQRAKDDLQEKRKELRSDNAKPIKKRPKPIQKPTRRSIRGRTSRR